MNVEQSLCDLTRDFWHFYLLNPSEENYQRIIAQCSDRLVMIGTGKHELYTSKARAAESLAGNLGEAEAIAFELLDEWYEGRMAAPGVCLVYGGFWARERAGEGGASLVEMDTRFSVLYAQGEDGRWQIVHIHHSIPYFDQAKGEYYPKALSAKVREALALADVFKRQAELDLMTAVYNHASFKKQVERQLQRREAAYLYILDLDHFKDVNDTYGHDAGDALLKLLAERLQGHFRERGIVGRIGGDEFAVCEVLSASREDIEARLEALRAEFIRDARALLSGHAASYSVGVTQIRPDGPTYREVYQQADEALYRAKKAGRDAVAWY